MSSFWAWHAVAVASYALLNFIVLPRIKTAWVASRPAVKLMKVGFVAGIESARNTALLATVVWSLFGVIAVALRFGYASNASALQAVVNGALWLHDKVDKIDHFWSRWYVFVPVALAVYFAWRKQKGAVSRQLERAIDEELDRLNRERNQDPKRWAGLTPDTTMQELLKKQLDLRQKLAAVSGDDTRARGARRDLRRALVQLEERLDQADYERRIDPRAVNEHACRAASAPTWKNFLISEGLVADMGAASKLVARSATGLLFLTLISASAASGATKDLHERMLKLDELRVASTSQQVKEAWDKAGHAAATEAALDAADRRALDHLTHEFVHALAHNAHWAIHPARTSAGMAQDMARQAVLRATRLPASSGEDASVFATELRGSEEDLVARATATEPKPSRSAQTLSEREGKGIVSRLGEHWPKVKQQLLQHAERYRVQVPMSDLQSELVDEVLSSVLDETLPEFGEDTLLKKLRSAVSATAKKTIAQGVTSQLHQVVEELDSGKSPSQALHDVQSDDLLIPRRQQDELAQLFATNQLPDEHAIARALAEHPGYLRRGGEPPSKRDKKWHYSSSDDEPGGLFASRDPGPHEPPPGPTDGPSGFSGPDTSPGGSRPRPPRPNSPGGGDAQRVIDDIARHETRGGQRSLSESAVDALAEYDDLFPRSVESQARTPLGRTLQRYQLPKDAGFASRLAHLKVRRAASFSMLRGFSRVGGVLIGTEPSAIDTSPDIVDLGWKIKGRAIELSLTDGAGKRASFGPFDVSLVHQALAFAADGRPVAVTMAKARPLSVLKVHLHPALLDTPLGCRVVQLDRLVDTYAERQLPERQQMAEHYREQLVLYRVAYAQRLRALSESDVVTPELAEELRTQSELPADVRAQAQLALSHAQDGERWQSVFARKPAYFDEELVRQTQRCAASSRREQHFEHCAKSTFSHSSALSSGDEAALQRWMLPAAAFEEWSGVREHPFHISGDLAFLRAPKPVGDDPTQRLWPFDFMVQLAFTSPPLPPPGEEYDLERAELSDEAPLEFSALAPTIAHLVWHGLKDSGDTKMLDELRSFTVLQRLFRAALKGQLGERFPLSKLAQLTTASAGQTPYAYTRRFSRSDSLQLGAELERRARAAQTDAPELAHAARACAEQWRDPASPEAKWQTACALSDTAADAMAMCSAEHRPALCELSEILVVLPELMEVRKLEATFGVLADEAANGGRTHCPPLAGITGGN